MPDNMSIAHVWDHSLSLYWLDSQLGPPDASDGTPRFLLIVTDGVIGS